MVERHVLESSIEGKVCSYARIKKCLERKMNGPGYRGWPDRIFFFQGRIIFVEFKQKGEKPDNLQRFMHGRLRDNSFHVYVVDNVQSGYDLIDKFTASGPLV